ncbi:MAG: enoyl-CoA hydratase-related protein [Chloroflexota bacterium]|nr:enoyl-CoA hydratase-related protein [Chloroflexota bacterium]
MLVLYETNDRITTITFNEPKGFHSMSPELFGELSNAMARFRDDNDALVAIVTGAGKRAFCAGADIKTMIPALGDPEYTLPPFTTRGMTVMKPTIAAVNGLALGGGLEIALSCDVRIAADHAIFGLPEVKLGLIPGWGGTQRLARLIGAGRAAELLLTGDSVDAAEAYRIGLVNKVVPLDDLLPAAREMATKMCKAGPFAVQSAKESMVRGLNMNLEDALWLEKSMFDKVLTTEDSVEGMAAFTEKRAANFKGK